ncbi:hypothetical protein D3C73_862160 [compost metagenome]
MPNRVQGAQCRVGFFAMHRRLDDARADRVYPDAALGVFDRQGFGRGVQAAFGQRSQHRWHAVDGVVDQAGGDVHHVAAAVFFHFGDGQLSDVEEAVQVHRQHVGVVFGGVLGERFGDEDAGVVDQGVDATETFDGFTDDFLRDFRVADVAGHGEDVRVGGRFDRTRGGDDFVVQVTECLDHACAQTLGGASDNDDFFRIAHDEPLQIKK